MDAVLMLAAVIAGLVGLNLAVWRWGVDSRDGFASEEWQRRRSWRGFGRD